MIDVAEEAAKIVVGVRAEHGQEVIEQLIEARLSAAASGVDDAADRQRIAGRRAHVAALEPLTESGEQRRLPDPWPPDQTDHRRTRVAKKRFGRGQLLIAIPKRVADVGEAQT